MPKRLSAITIVTALLTTVAAGVTVLGTARPSGAAPVFADTGGIVEEPNIARLKALGVVTGDQGRFDPQGTFTRIQAATLAVRLSGLGQYAPMLQQPTVFPDVEQRHSWAWGYINVAVAHGLVKGTPDGKFLPDKPITELEAAVLFLNALGYRGAMPGGWPTGYMMKALDLGIIGEGFQPDRPATRAFVAKVADLVLEREVVHEKEGKPGEYEGEGESFYERIFGGSLIENPALVKAVDVAGGRIELEGFLAPIKCATGMGIYGKEGPGDLEGHLVVGATNSRGELIFIRVVTPSEVAGVIAEVDGINRRIVVGGVSLEVEETAYVEKNGVEQRGTIAATLASVLGADARVYLRDGRAYRIIARYTEKLEGLLTDKKVTSTPAGITYFVWIDGVEYALAENASLIRNGATAQFSHLKVGDPCLYVVEGGKIVWLDAWRVEVDNVRVVDKSGESGTWTVTVEKDGLRTSYRVKDSSVFDDPDMGAGMYCKLLVDRDRVVYDVTPPSQPPTAIGRIKSTSVGLKDSKTCYAVVLEDGRTFEWDEAALAQVTVFRNGRIVAAPPMVVPPVQAVWTMFVPGEHARMSYGSSGKIETVDLFTPGRLQGITSSVSHGPNVTSIQLKDALGAIFAQFDLENSAPIVLNGLGDTAASIAGGDVLRFSWDISLGKAVEVEVARFTELIPHTVAAITQGDTGDIWLTLAHGVTLVPTGDAIVVRSGVRESLADIAVGDKLRYNISPPFNYFEVYTDSTKPGYRHGAARWTGGNVEVTLWFDEEIWELRVIVDGAERVFSPDGDDRTRWTWTSAGEYSLEPGSVAVSFEAKDYAKNVLTKTVTIPVTQDVPRVPPFVPPVLPPF